MGVPAGAPPTAHAEFLADVIWVLHLLFVLWVVIAPFTNSSCMLTLHLIVIPSLWLHWGLGDSSCCLSWCEAYLRGKDAKATFLNRIVAPVYTVNQTDMGTFCWCASLVLWLITVSKVYGNPSLVKDAFSPPRSS